MVVTGIKKSCCWTKKIKIDRYTVSKRTYLNHIDNFWATYNNNDNEDDDDNNDNNNVEGEEEKDEAYYHQEERALKHVEVIIRLKKT